MLWKYKASFYYYKCSLGLSEISECNSVKTYHLIITFRVMQWKENIRTAYFKIRMIIMIMGTAENLFYSSHKICFRRGVNATLLCRLQFLYVFVSNILPSSFCFLLSYSKNIWKYLNFLNKVFWLALIFKAPFSVIGILMKLNKIFLAVK